MKPIVVADHGSANASKYTKHNIEIQGLKLWLSGIGRPTGNARTERVIGTLKREEINLQEQYANETEAKNSLGTAIWDYNNGHFLKGVLISKNENSSIRFIRFYHMSNFLRWSSKKTGLPVAIR
jgi:transposase InsO family protein